MQGSDAVASLGPAWIVVTDLDGTLLDHQSYSYQAAQSALDRLQQDAIPLILNTSKTRGELLPLRRSLDNMEPFIVENGSAVFLPCQRFSAAQSAEDTVPVRPLDGDAGVSELRCKVFGQDYATIVAWLQARRDRFHFECFSDYSIAELVERTGLAAEQARLALAREFSEPLVWQDTDEALGRFSAELTRAGFSTLRGGRFLHVLGRCDKGQSLVWLRDFYRRQWRRQVRVVALGDSYNDIAMLQAADIAVVVRSPCHDPPPVTGPTTVIVSDREGPQGWAEVIHSLLDRAMM